MDNLRFGNQTEHGDEEILQLSSLVGLSKRLIQDPSIEVGMNGNQLSTTERASICIARALLSSVDLLLLGGAFDVLTNEHAESIVKELKEWVACRGMRCLQAENDGAVDTKKMKTVFYVTNNSYLDDIADCRIRLAEDSVSVDSAENAQAGSTEDPVQV